MCRICTGVRSLYLLSICISFPYCQSAYQEADYFYQEADDLKLISYQEADGLKFISYQEADVLYLYLIYNKTSCLLISAGAFCLSILSGGCFCRLRGRCPL